ERVVRRRGGILVPPVPADEAVVRVAQARIRRDAVDDAPEREGAYRGRSIPLAVTRGEAVAADPAAPPSARGAPAAVAPLPEADRREGRRTARCGHGDELRRRARRGDWCRTGEGGDGGGDYAHGENGACIPRCAPPRPALRRAGIAGDGGAARRLVARGLSSRPRGPAAAPALVLGVRRPPPRRRSRRPPPGR